MNIKIYMSEVQLKSKSTTGSKLLDNEKDFEDMNVISSARDYAWRRFFARFIDICVTLILICLAGMIISLICGIPFNPYNLLMSDNLILNFLKGGANFICSGLMNAFMFKFKGNTLGKMLYGIEVCDSSGNHINFSTALKRETLIIFKGLGLGIPVLAHITLFINWRNFLKDRITSWDKDLNLKVIYKARSRFKSVVTNILVFGVYLALIMSLTNIYN